jgi:anthranilate synthase component 2
MPKILILDNYDSFVYNLHQYTEEISGQKVDVFKNDQIDLESVGSYDIIFLSPGPGIPEEAGIMMQLIRRYGPEKRIFGICLGHQAIAQAYGARLENPNQVFHGVESKISISDRSELIFKSLPPKIQAGRYHSWVVSQSNFPKELQVTATDEVGNIMALRHRIFDVRGVQFHPESIMTPYGKQMIECIIKV